MIRVRIHNPSLFVEIEAMGQTKSHPLLHRLFTGNIGTGEIGVENPKVTQAEQSWVWLRRAEWRLDLQSRMLSI